MHASTRIFGISFFSALVLVVTFFLLHKSHFGNSSERKISFSETDSALLIMTSDTFPENNLEDTGSIDTTDTSFKYLNLNDLLLNLDTAQFMQNASYGFCLRDAKTGEIIEERNPNQSLVPASVIKVVTTGVALELAGANYQFRTRLQYDGKLDTINHILYGNIYIRGGGDPTLGSDIFTGNDLKNLMKRWKKAIKNLGIDSIHGAIIADARFFEYEMIPQGWNWGDMKSDYGAGVSGLSFRENTFDVVIQDGNITKMYPQIPDLQLFGKLSLVEDAPKSFVMLSGAPYDGKRILQGVVKLGKVQERCPMPDPAYTCAYTLWKALEQDSMSVRDSATTVLKLKRKKQYEETERTDFQIIMSPKLKYLIQHTNTVSQNFYAETLFKLIGIKGGSYGGSYAASQEIRAFWNDKNLKINGFWQTDGSGLSRSNAISPKLLTKMLVYFHNDSVHFQDYYNSLAIAGRTGTMAKLGIGTVAENNLRAKSGTMGRVKGYAGYVHDRSGRLLTFALISNNHVCSASEMRRYFEGIMIKIAELGEPKSTDFVDIKEQKPINTKITTSDKKISLP